MPRKYLRKVILVGWIFVGFFGTPSELGMFRFPSAVHGDRQLAKDGHVFFSAGLN